MTANSLPITLETVTPIWTGGAKGEADRLHATGIMGSLRWWYEALVRGVGGRVCEPSQDNCSYDKDAPYEGLCDVCRIFGATGWARRFKLTVIDQERLQQKSSSASILDRGKRVFVVPHDNDNADSRWYLNGNPRAGSFTLEIAPTFPLSVTKFLSEGESPKYLDVNIIGALLQFIADNASLGAKPQMGLGIVRLKDRRSTQPLTEHLEELIDLYEKNGDSVSFDQYDELPSLHTMFFMRLEAGKKSSDLETFKLKYNLRKEFQKFTADVRHSILGYAPKSWEKEEDRQGAKVMMSYPYDDDRMPYGNHTIRLWGWIPGKADMQPSRGVIFGKIYAFLAKRYGEDSIPGLVHFLYDAENGRSVLEHCKKYLLKEA